MSWAGYFFKATASNTIFDMRYIQYDSYQSTPNQREEIKAYRDENTRDLYRVTAAGKKSKIEFTTMPNLTLAEKQAIQAFFRNNATLWSERKIQLTYWNDEDNTYYTSYFYIPDITFSIKRVDSSGPIYNALSIHLVEY